MTTSHCTIHSLLLKALLILSRHKINISMTDRQRQIKKNVCINEVHGIPVTCTCRTQRWAQHTFFSGLKHSYTQVAPLHVSKHLVYLMQSHVCANQAVWREKRPLGRCWVPALPPFDYSWEGRKVSISAPRRRLARLVEPVTIARPATETCLLKTQ